MNLKNTDKLMSMERPQIIKNAIQTPDGTILHSEYRYDYITHIDTTNNVEYMRDGGTDYIRGAGSPFIDLTVTTSSSHEDIREAFLWTSMLDAEGNKIEPIQRKLSELEDNHVLSLVKWTSEYYPDYIHWIIENEADYRGLL
jgi:hypothetical protein